MFLHQERTRRATHQNDFRTVGILISGMPTADMIMLAAHRRTNNIKASMKPKGHPLVPTTLLTISRVTTCLRCTTRVATRRRRFSPQRMRSPSHRCQSSDYLTSWPKNISLSWGFRLHTPREAIVGHVPPTMEREILTSGGKFPWITVLPRAGQEYLPPSGSQCSHSPHCYRSLTTSGSLARGVILP